MPPKRCVFVRVCVCVCVCVYVFCGGTHVYQCLYAYVWVVEEDDV